MKLDGQKVLFIAPTFYQYHIAIIKQLEALGGEVTFKPEMEQTLWYRIIQKFSTKAKAEIENQFRQSLLDDIEPNEFDVVVIIRGGYFDTAFMRALRYKLTEARFVMYQWDSALQNNYLDVVSCFDRVMTFDRDDAEQYQLEYLPLFYMEQYASLRKNESEKQFDITFFGAYHSDRLEVVKQVSRICVQQNLVFKHHLYIKKLALLRLWVTGVISIKDMPYLKTYSVTSDEIIDTYKKTKAVLDIELNIQSGLTMRTFEVLGAGLKLLTTNSRIKKEKFFDDSKIGIIDRNNLKIPASFFQKNTERDDAIFCQYHIKNWLINLLAT